MTGQEISRLPANTDADVLAEVLRRDGGLILEGLISQEQVDSINSQLQPHVDARKSGFKEGFDGAFYGVNTKRIQGIAAKCPAFVDSILLNPVLLNLADRILLKNCGHYWLSQAETIFIGPGNPEQELHRDDINWANAADLGIDLQISVLTAIGDYDTEVGATRVVPGSHKWEKGRKPAAHEIVSARMETGSALVYLGSLVHGGGRNSTLERWRKGLYCSYLLGWLTPEEAVALSLTPEIAAKLPQRARELLGWSNLHGNPTDAGAEAALQLWQLDQLDRQRLQGLYVER